MPVINTHKMLLRSAYAMLFSIWGKRKPANCRALTLLSLSPPVKLVNITKQINLKSQIPIALLTPRSFSTF